MSSPAADLPDGGPPPSAERVEERPLQMVSAGPPSVHAAALALLGALSGAASVLAPRALAESGLFPCPLRAATGWPCPGCGATHALLALGHGDLAGALFANPLFALAALGLWLHAVWTLLRFCGLRRVPHLGALPSGGPEGPGRTRRARFWALGVCLANWAFVALVSGGGVR